MPPAISATHARWMIQSGIGKPVVLLAIFCALLMPLSNPIASNAFSDSAVIIHDVLPDDPIAHGLFIQRQILHIATHPRAGVPFLTAFLTEAERLCQPHAHQSPGFPCPNAASTWLLEATSIALPTSWALAAIGANLASAIVSPGLADGREPPPGPPPPKTTGPAR